MIYKILHLEDSKVDADLLQRVLRKSGMEFTIYLAEDESSYRKGLAEFRPDVILCDHTLPQFDSKKAYDVYLEKELDIPFILVTGTVSEEFAVEMMKKGVDDYLLKTNLQRLPQAIQSDVIKRRNERMLQSIHSILEQSEAHLRTLFETSSLGLMLLDAEGKILEINTVSNLLCKRAFGLTLQKNELLFDQLPEFRRKDMREKFASILLGRKVNYESKYPQEDGSSVFFNVNISPVIGTNGSVHGGCLIMEDITQKKSLLEEQMKFHEQFRLLANNMSDMVALHNVEGLIEYVSPSCEKLTGFTQEELLGTDPYSYVHPDDLKLAAKGHEISKKTELIPRLPFRFRKKDGDYLWMETKATPIFDPITNQLVALQSASRDVTERINNEAEKARASELIRLLAENMSDMVALHSPSGQYSFVSPSCEKILGYTAEELAGVNPYTLMHPDDIEPVSIRHQQTLAGATFIAEYRLRHKDGNYVWVESSAAPIMNDKDEVTQMQSITRDIRERKINEDKLQKSFKELSDYKHALDVSSIISISDGSGVIQYVNENFCTVTGYSPEEVVGKTHQLINSGTHSGEFFEELWQTILSGKVWRNEIKNKAKDGSFFWTDVTIVPFLDKDGKPIQFVAMRYDTTNRKTAEEALAATAQDLKQVLTSNPDIFYVINTNYRITLINTTAERMLALAWGKKVSLGDDIRELIPRDSTEPIEDSFSKVFRGQHIEYEVCTQIEGRHDWFLVSHSPVFSKEDASKVTSAYVVTKDITTRKMAELALRKSELFSNNILSSITSHIAVVGAEGEVIKVNKAWDDFSRENGASDLSRTGVGSNYLEVCRAAARQDETAAKVVEGFGMVIGRELPFFEIEYPCHGPQTERWFLLRISRFIDDPPQVVIMHVDISERKKAEEEVTLSEEKYKMLFRNNPMPMWVVETKTANFLAVNKAAVLHYGYSEAEFLQLTEADLRPSKFKSGSEEAYQDDLHHLNTTGTWQHRIKNGDLIHVEVFSYPIIFENKLSRLILANDITQRIKAEEQVLRSQQQFKGLIENIKGVYWVFNTDLLKTLYVSPSYEKIWGRSSEDLYKDSSDFLKAIVPEDLEMVMEGFEKMNERPYQEFEYRIAHPDGSIHWIASKMKLITDKEGFKIQYGYAEDVTDEKIAEEELVRSKTRFQSIIENISGVYWVNDLETYQTLYISPSYEKIWGRSCEDLYKNSQDFINAIHPADKEKLFAAYKNIAKSQQLNITYRIVRPDGDIRWISAKINVATDSAAKKIEYGYADDITERRKAEEELKDSEEKYKLLFKRNPLPMWVLDSETLGFLAVNEAALLHYGYSECEFLELTALDIRPETEKPLPLQRSSAKHDSAYYGGVWKHSKKNGELIDVEIFAYNIEYEGKKAKLILSNDITEKLKAEQLLEKSYDDIQRLVSHLQKVREEERKLIAREIHDELGQQLTVMKMDISWLQARLGGAEPVVDRRMEDLLAMMDNNIQSVRKIAFDLRPSMLDDVGLTSTIEWYAEEFRKRTGITVSVESKGELEVPPDLATNLYRVYQEGLTNVARHSGATLVKVTLETKNERVFISISDNGKGFNVKEKSDKTLGLLGMKERAAIMNGEFHIQSKAGKGTIIVVSVPLVETENKLPV